MGVLNHSGALYVTNTQKRRTSRGIERYQRYQNYRDAHVEGLTEVPAHWTVTTLKRIGEVRGGTGFPEDEQGAVGEELPFFKVGDMAAEGNEPTMLHTPNTISRVSAKRLRAFIFPPRTIVFAKVGAALLLNRRRFLGRDSCIDNNMMGFIPRACEDAWAFYWLSGLDLAKLANPGAIPSVNESQMRDTPVMLPPAREQRAISNFLEREIAKIDALVAKKRRLIDLLHERQVALITRTVTRGLDTAIQTKDSGVAAIGNVPAHWRVMALAYATVSRCDGPFGSGLKSEHYTSAGIRVVRLQNIGWAEFLNRDEAYVSTAHADALGDHKVLAGDLLIAGLGDESHPVGRACVAPPGIEPAMVKADCFRFRLDKRILLSDFAALQLSATATVTSRETATGATRARMNLSTTASRRVAVPTLGEQREIVQFIARERQKYMTITERIKMAIRKLLQLRAAIIAATVTGQIDVREEEV